MIIACPACATRYVVPDSAIGVDGRTVRCAKCRHSWFQAGAELPQRPAAAVATTPSAPAPDSAPPADRPEPVDAAVAAPPRPVRPAVRQTPVVDPAETGPSSFDHAVPFRPRRNPVKMWTAASISFAVLVSGFIGAVSWFGLPDWVPVQRPTFGPIRSDLELSFPAGRQDRRTLPNGAEYFGASGTVTNVGKEVRDLPPILIVLRDERNRIVYKWVVNPPRETLRPGESVTVNEAVTDVPKTARIAEIGWKPG